EMQDGSKTKNYKNIDNVTEQYRDKVKNLIEMSEKNNLKIEVGANFDETPRRNNAVITLERGNVAALFQAVCRILPQMRRNPIKLITPGNEMVRIIGSPDGSLQG